MHAQKPTRIRGAALAGFAVTIGMTVALVTAIGTSPAQAISSRAWTLYTVGSTVTPIDTATGTAGTPITVGSAPYAIAITPDGATAYVTNTGNGTVTPIATATNTAGTPIPVGARPFGIAITPDGATAYVTNNSDDTVTPIDTATNTAGTPIPVGTLPFGIAITPNGATAYVANTNDDTVTPIVTATNTAEPPINVRESGPVAIAITPNGGTAYVANSDGTVVPIDTATNTAGNPIPVGLDPTGIAITPNGATAYVTNQLDNTVTPIDLASNTAGTPIPVGTNPTGIAITPNGATVYVSNTRDKTVTPIDTATNTAGTPIPVPAGLAEMAITPDQAPVAQLSVTTAQAGQPTSFDARGSTVAFGTISTYVWDFGDGSTATTSTPTTTHTYATPGPYTAKVIETDSAGTSTTQVFTGQTVSRNGGSSAVASQSFTVTAAEVSLHFTGAITYVNSGPLTSGGFTIDPGVGTINSLTGTGAIPGLSGGSAHITVNIHRIWLWFLGFRQIYIGTIDVDDSGANLDTTALVITTNLTRSGSTGVSGVAYGLATNRTGLIYTLDWTI